MAEPTGTGSTDGLRSLTPKTKPPSSASILNTWITQAEAKLGPGSGGGRLGWLIASSVAVAAVRRAVDTDSRQLFLLKGGTLPHYRRMARVLQRTREPLRGTGLRFRGRSCG